MAYPYPMPRSNRRGPRADFNWVEVGCDTHVETKGKSKAKLAMNLMAAIIESTGIANQPDVMKQLWHLIFVALLELGVAPALSETQILQMMKKLPLAALVTISQTDPTDEDAETAPILKKQEIKQLNDEKEETSQLRDETVDVLFRALKAEVAELQVPEWPREFARMMSDNKAMHSRPGAQADIMSAGQQFAGRMITFAINLPAIFKSRQDLILPFLQELTEKQLCGMIQRLKDEHLDLADL